MNQDSYYRIQNLLQVLKQQQKIHYRVLGAYGILRGLEPNL